MNLLETKKVVSSNIKGLMEIRRIGSVAALAKSSGVSKSLIHYLINEDHFARADTLHKLGTALNCPAWALLMPNGAKRYCDTDVAVLVDSFLLANDKDRDALIRFAQAVVVTGKRG